MKRKKSTDRNCSSAIIESKHGVSKNNNWYCSIGKANRPTQYAE